MEKRKLKKMKVLEPSKEMVLAAEVIYQLSEIWLMRE